MDDRPLLDHGKGRALLACYGCHLGSPIRAMAVETASSRMMFLRIAAKYCACELKRVKAA
jgi:hypothetical protein